MHAFRPQALLYFLCLLIVSCQNPWAPRNVDHPSDDPAMRDQRVIRLEDQTTFLEVTIPVYSGLNPALVPPITTIRWQTIHGAQHPDSVQWMMISTKPFDDSWNETLEYIRTNPDAPEWSPWHPYDPANDIGTSWTTPPQDFGAYVFAVHGKKGDIVGQEFDWVRNVRRIIVSRRTTGPLLTVTSVFFDPIQMVIEDTAPTIIDIPGGIDIQFCWTADASMYGGVVEGYRYGWDILDPDDDSQWAIPFTPFAQPEECSPVRTFLFGTHTFHVEVIDNNDFKSRVPIHMNIELPAKGLFDIQPGSCQNPFNPKSRRMMATAIVGTNGLDVHNIDISSVLLEGVSPIRSKFKDILTPTAISDGCNCTIHEPDGYDDLILCFRTEDIVEALGWEDYRNPKAKKDGKYADRVPRILHPGDEILLTITASLLNGIPFEASDCIVIVGHQDDGVCREALWLFDGTGVDDTGKHSATLQGGATFVATPEGQGLFTEGASDLAEYDPPISQMDAGQIVFRFKLDEDFPPLFGFYDPIVIITSDRSGIFESDFSIQLTAIDGRLWFSQERATPIWLLRTEKNAWGAGIWYEVIADWGPSGRQLKITWDGGAEVVSDEAAAPCFSADAAVRAIGARGSDSPPTGLTIERIEVRCEGKNPEIPIAHQ
ncbi:MAG: hypothetical protein GTO29_12015 [Candidatus Latescibacteria bacterium]|nr:hypothetical protein [Candidatus Latescibacterota bacterium]NIO56889.1 hypothetical protein [Candidatus Latescibacterota bacterium]